MKELKLTQKEYDTLARLKDENVYLYGDIQRLRSVCSKVLSVATVDDEINFSEDRTRI